MNLPRTSQFQRPLNIHRPSQRVQITNMSSMSKRAGPPKIGSRDEIFQRPAKLARTGEFRNKEKIVKPKTYTSRDGMFKRPAFLASDPMPRDFRTAEKEWNVQEGVVLSNGTIKALLQVDAREDVKLRDLIRGERVELDQSLVSAGLLDQATFDLLKKEADDIKSNTAKGILSAAEATQRTKDLEDRVEAAKIQQGILDELKRQASSKAPVSPSKNVSWVARLDEVFEYATVASSKRLSDQKVGEAFVNQVFSENLPQVKQLVRKIGRAHV